MEPDAKVFQTLEMPFATPSAYGNEAPLSTRYHRIMPENRLEYVRLALNYRWVWGMQRSMKSTYRTTWCNIAENHNVHRTNNFSVTRTWLVNAVM